MNRFIIAHRNISHRSCTSYPESLIVSSYYRSMESIMAFNMGELKKRIEGGLSTFQDEMNAE